MNREYHRWHSPHLNRDMELLVFGHAGAKVLVFPTRDGRFYEYENLGLVDTLSHRINGGTLQLFCVDSVFWESLYCFWSHPADRIHRHIRYEEYILREVLPFIAQKNGHPITISHGCSLGAYNAAAIAFRHPHLFQRLVAFSGRYDLTLNVESFRDLFDGHYDDRIYFHMPTHFLENLGDSGQMRALRRMDITLTIGAEDPFLGNNHHLSHILNSKQVPHQLYVWEGRAHQGRYWRHMASHYLDA